MHSDDRSECLSLPNLGDRGVIQHGQCLVLGLEAGDDLPRVHSGLDELQGHGATDGGPLLGAPDLTHAAGADPLTQGVRS